MMDNTHEENVDEEEEDLVDEYMCAPTDFKRICNHYYRREDEFDEDGNALDHPPNPAALPCCLNIVSPLIRDIPDGAFNQCRSVTDLRVRQGGRRRIILRTIGKCAFRWTGVRRINQFLKQGGVLRLEDAAFLSCDIEGELVIPSSVLWVGEYCFGWCDSITSVVFEPSSMTGTIVEINNGAFTWCLKLSSATLPPTLERIPENCFEGCIALIHVPIPPTVVELERESFVRCKSLPSMELPESVEVIGAETFLDCTALTTVTIRTPSLNLRIGDNVFRGCTSLSTIQTYPWHWGKLLSSMENDANFLNNFFNGTLRCNGTSTSLASINLNSWYGPHILEAVKDQPSLLYRVLRQFQQQRFETNAPRTTMMSFGQCILCMTAYRTHAFVPCGHLCVCQSCAKQVTTVASTEKERNTDNDEKEEHAHCPFCNQSVNSAIEIYLP